MAITLESLPKTQLEAVRYFGDAQNCHDFIVQMRWPEGIRCAHCNSDQVGNLVVSETPSRSKTKPGVVTRRLWNCKACKKQFTTKTGTIFEDSALGLDKWLPAVWMIVNAKNGVSSCELARSLGVTQKSAWHMGHRIRLAMRSGGFQLSGTVEADEAYIGGKYGNMHRERREKLKKQEAEAGPATKVAVLGVLQRSPMPAGSKVILDAVDRVAENTLKKHVRANVKHGSALYTDGHLGYVGLRNEYEHEFIDHTVTYARGAVHTNSLENFWSLLRRTLTGTYVQTSREHLFRYLDEQATRFNERADDDRLRFLSTMQRASGRRLPYAVLSGRAWLDLGTKKLMPKIVKDAQDNPPKENPPAGDALPS